MKPRLLDLFCGAGGAAIPPVYTEYIGKFLMQSLQYSVVKEK